MVASIHIFFLDFYFYSSKFGKYFPKSYKTKQPKFCHHIHVSFGEL